MPTHSTDRTAPPAGACDSDTPLLDPVTEIITDGYEFRIFLRDEDTTCMATLHPRAGSSTPLSPSDVIGALASCGVTFGLDENAIAALCGSLPGGTPPEGSAIARGTPPVPGREATADLAVGFDTGVASYAVKADGSVDFHNRTACDTVEEGQEIGVFHPAQRGTPGITVTGREIPPPPQAKPDVALGRGVRLDPASGKIHATAAGRVVFVKNIVSVEEEFIVKGDVDFDVGNIRIPGYVVIGGDVLDDFSVTGGKGIKVGGTVGAASLHSEGDITLAGVSGKTKGRIVCGGTLRAGFLDEVDVECGGDVIVQFEIRNAMVRSGGSILVPHGTIAGGECIARNGIEAGTVGSVMGVRTKLSSGVDYRQRGRVNILKGKTRVIDGEIRKIETAVGPMHPDDDAFKALPAPRKEALSKLIETLETLRNSRRILDEEIAGIQSEKVSASNPMLNAHGKIMESTTIALGNATVQIIEEVKGPVSIIENTREETLRFLPLHPLSVNAGEIEARILHEEDARKARGEDPVG